MKHIESLLWTLLLLAMNMAMPFSARAEGKYQLTVTAKPVMAGSFNTNVAELAAGETIHLYAYANANFTFVGWTDDKGDVVSQQMDFTYVMPAHDVTLTAEYEYNPANPSNPAQNYWKKELGEVIVDDFTTGALQNAVKNVIGDSKSTDVVTITVAGIMNGNDFGIINTYSACMVLDLSRVTGVTQVPSYAFDNTKLESVYLPTTIEKIGQRAFYNCQQLSSLIVYSMAPPTLENDVFLGVPEGLVVYVPANAIGQYQEADVWKNFTILPIQEDIRSMSVSLPENVNAADYTKMWLELTNTKSGQRMHYIMTDRRQYTFANIIRNTTWNVTLRNERGDIFGQIDNVEVKDEDVAVVFSTLSKPQNVALIVKTPDGQNVTAQTQITWTDARGNYVAQGASLTGLRIGYQTSYRVALSQELSMLYQAPQPVEYVLKDGGNDIVCQLQAIKQLQISGKVKDVATGQPLSGTTVSASQTFGGKYSKTLSAKTDNSGSFTLTIANVPTSVAFAASDYVSQTLDLTNYELSELNEFTVPDVSLKSITGATITMGFTYTSVDGETQNWYSDYQNVSYTLYNITRDKPISQYNVQYPQIVLLEEVEDGDVLRLKATSRTNAFMPVEATVTIAEQKAEATFGIEELGKIQAAFTTTGNASVVGSLYDATGKLLKTYDYANTSLTISNLTDGSYTLVTMGSSRLFNTIYDLAQLPQTGLAEGTDYVTNTVEVKSGTISQISIDKVPILDESKLYYTGDNTSFTVNKPSIVAGNYLTLTGRIDFKPTYATSVSNVQMIVDLPESCEFVENSVIVGNSTSSYTLNNHQITISMNRYTDRVRFCIIPTLGGEYAPSAFVQFDLDGETMTQPIGSANYTAKDLSISVPSTVAKTSVPVSGTAIGKSEIEIYDNDVLIGQTTSLANGTWAITCELNEPYNMSRHKIYAKVKTKQGIHLNTESVLCVYDRYAIQVSKVKMYHWNPEANNWHGANYEMVFDFQNPTNRSQYYVYYIYNPKFTFTVDFTKNDTTLIKNVLLKVKTGTGKCVILEPHYDKKSNSWIATAEFGNMYDGDIPKNVAVSFYVDNVAVYEESMAEDLQFFLNNLHDNDFLTEEDKLFDEELEKDSVNIDELIRRFTIINVHRPNYIPPSLGDDNEDNFYKKLIDSNSDEVADVFNNHYNDIYKKYYNDFGIKTSNDLGNSDVFSPGEYTFNTDNEKIIIKIISNNSIDILKELSEFKIDVAEADNGKLIFRKKDTDNRIEIEFPNYNLGTISDSDLLKNLKKIDEIKLWAYNGFSVGATVLENNLEKMIDDSAEALGNILSDIKNGKGSYNANKEKAKNIRKEQKKAIKRRGRLKGIQKGISRVGAAYDTFSDLYKGFKDFDNWEELSGDIYYVCGPDVGKELESLSKKIQKEITRKNILKGMGDVASNTISAVGIGATGLSGGLSIGLTGIGVLASIGMGYYGDCISRDNKRNLYSFLQIARSKCKSFPEDWNEWIDYLGEELGYSIDPSGYVYEGVPTNRIEGVTATVYYKEMVEDMYGDLHENIVKWDAEEYAQENPLFTDENGFYRWDVPQGLWQVKFEKEGYETTYSEWLPVPPPQLDINIAMKQNRQPEVKAARAYEDAVEVEFDKYMMPELLNAENIIVMQNGTAVEGTVELLNEEASYEGETEKFASKIRFNAAQPFEAQEIMLTVSNRVKSYAGIRMQDNYQQTFTIEPEIKEIVSEPDITIGYGKTGTVSVEVKPAAASAGKILRVTTSSPLILSVGSETAVVGEDGKASFTVNGELPGSAALTFSLDGYDLTGTSLVSVSQDFGKVTAMPVSNIVSGSLVSKGTPVILTCSTQGATIYYTLDGSCPCDETKRIAYDGTPINIERNVVIKAMAVAPNMEESEIMNAVYIVLKGDVNCDGQVDTQDAILTIQQYLGENDSEVNKMIADMNNDGIIDTQDAILIIEQYLNHE